MDFNGDRTVIIPIPGGGQGDLASSPVSPAFKEEGGWQSLFDNTECSMSSGFNKLESAAFKLLSLIPVIRKSHTNPSPALLRQQMVEEVEAYETNARQAGVDSKTALIGRYVLCAVLDEVVLNTPWVGQSDWQKNSLLSLFHKETWGGENFFVMLTNLEKDPRTNIDLLELMYVCLSLGFEGRYAVENDRQTKLAEIRARLFRVISHYRSEPSRMLSLNALGVTIANRNLRRFMPLWVFATILGGFLAAGLFWLVYSLNQLSYSPYIQLADLARDTETVLDRPKVVDLSALETLKVFLKPEIDEGLVTVDERESKVRITLLGDLFFNSGQANMSNQYQHLIKRIGLSLLEVEGKVLVEGHSDSQPINTLKFPSNWHLSTARAETVARQLEIHTKETGRFGYEGKADTEPVADNATAEGRALNRRVEIVLLSNVIWRSGGIN